MPSDVNFNNFVLIERNYNMSAFIVEDVTVNKVISKLAADRDGEWIKRKVLKAGYDLETHEGKNKLGWDMFSLNIRAVNMRYDDKPADQFRPLNYKYVGVFNCQKIHCLKALQCWLYQCSEGDCDQSPLYKLMEEIKNEWALDIVRKLPEYDQAAWG